MSSESNELFSAGWIKLARVTWASATRGKRTILGAFFAFWGDARGESSTFFFRCRCFLGDCFGFFNLATCALVALAAYWTMLRFVKMIQIIKNIMTQLLTWTTIFKRVILQLMMWARKYAKKQILVCLTSRNINDWSSRNILRNQIRLFSGSGRPRKECCPYLLGNNRAVRRGGLVFVFLRWWFRFLLQKPWLLDRSWVGRFLATLTVLASWRRRIGRSCLT